MAVEATPLASLEAFGHLGFSGLSSSFHLDASLRSSRFQALLAQSWSGPDTRVSSEHLDMPACARPCPAQPPGRQRERTSFRNLRIYARRTIRSSSAGLEV